MKHTVIALFDDPAQARQAADALNSRGFDRSAVHVAAETSAAAPESTEGAEIQPLPAAVAIEGGPASGLLHRLAGLFGVDDEPHVAHYEEAVRRGGTVVTVDADDETEAATARDALLEQGAVNIDDRVEEWRQAGWVAGDGTAAGAGVAVHRHEVSIGGVRVYGRTGERRDEDKDGEA